MLRWLLWFVALASWQQHMPWEHQSCFWGQCCCRCSSFSVPDSIMNMLVKAGIVLPLSGSHQEFIMLWYFYCCPTSKRDEAGELPHHNKLWGVDLSDKGRKRADSWPACIIKKKKKKLAPNLVQKCRWKYEGITMSSKWEVGTTEGKRRRVKQRSNKWTDIETESVSVYEKWTNNDGPSI